MRSSDQHAGRLELLTLGATALGVFVWLNTQLLDSSATQYVKQVRGQTHAR
jgi:hypothetical protein